MLLYIHAECIIIRNEVSPLPRNKYPEETVQKILDVSIKLFVEKGYEQTTVLDIVNNLGGLTRGAFYHHFKSKEEVLLALTEKMFQDHSPIHTIKARTDLNGLEKLRAIFLSQPGITDTPEKESVVALTRATLSLLEQPHFLAEQFKSNQMQVSALTPFVEEGMQDGSIRPGNPKLLAELIMLFFNVWMLPSLFPMEAEEFIGKAEIIEECLDTLGCPLMNEEFEEASEAFAELLNIENP